MWSHMACRLEMRQVQVRVKANMTRSHLQWVNQCQSELGKSHWQSLLWAYMTNSCVAICCNSLQSNHTVLCDHIWPAGWRWGKCRFGSRPTWQGPSCSGWTNVKVNWENHIDNHCCEPIWQIHVLQYVAIVYNQTTQYYVITYGLQAGDEASAGSGQGEHDKVPLAVGEPMSKWIGKITLTIIVVSLYDKFMCCNMLQ